MASSWPRHCPAARQLLRFVELWLGQRQTADQHAERAVEFAAAGLAVGTPGFLGLHLEGPHLDSRRKGAHDAAHIRPMTAADLALYTTAARHLPALMITLAPASVTPEQVVALAAAGVIVSLGHAEATGAEAQALIATGTDSRVIVQDAEGNFRPVRVRTGRSGGAHGQRRRPH